MDVAVLVIFFLLLFIFGLFKAEIKRIVGEKTISSILYFLNKSDYKVIHNVVLKTGDITSQIDHIVISNFGLFVIETKNYKGWIVGHENSEYWTQIIFRYKTKFYSPIRQNSGHIRALKSCLKEYPTLEYKSIIVFSTKAEIKVTTKMDVINSNRLLQTVKKYSQVNLTETEKENIYQKIMDSTLTSFNKSEHVQSIKRRIKSREDAIQKNKCPQCGNNLVEQKGKFGNFLGCKSYPRCKFTRKI